MYELRDPLFSDPGSVTNSLRMGHECAAQTLGSESQVQDPLWFNFALHSAPDVQQGPMLRPGALRRVFACLVLLSHTPGSNMVRAVDPKSPLKDRSPEHIRRLIVGEPTQNALPDEPIPFSYLNFNALLETVDENARFYSTKSWVATVRCTRGMGHHVPADVEEKLLADRIRKKMNRLKETIAG